MVQNDVEVAVHRLLCSRHQLGGGVDRRVDEPDGRRAGRVQQGPALKHLLALGLADGVFWWDAKDGKEGQRSILSAAMLYPKKAETSPLAPGVCLSLRYHPVVLVQVPAHPQL